MKNAFSRMVALLVCAAMLFGMVPHLGVSAAELETQSPETAAVETTAPETIPEETTVPTEAVEETTVETTEETVEEVTEETTAETTEETVELVESDPEVMADAEAAMTQEELLAAIKAAEGFYYLEETVTLTSDFTLDANNGMMIQSEGSLVVPAGMTLTVKNAIILMGGTLDVQGNLIIDGGEIQVNQGTWNMVGSLTAEPGRIFQELGSGVINNVDKSYIAAKGSTDSIAELETILNSGEGYYYLEATLGRSATLDRNITVPSGAFLYLSKNWYADSSMVLTISDGYSLTNYGVISLGADTEILIEEDGTLYNYGGLSLNSGTLTNHGQLIEDEEESGSLISFDTFEELQALCEKSYSVYTTLEYTGTGELVMQDITMPENTTLYALYRDVRIPEGVTATIYSAGIKNLTVEGTLIVDNSLEVTTNLSITGKVYSNNAWFNFPGALIHSGLENIVYQNDEGHISWGYNVTSEEDLIACAGAAAAATDPHWGYQATVSADNITLTKDLRIPAKMDTFVLKGTFTVPANVTLTVDGFITAYADMVINGNLVNQYVVAVSDRADSSITFGSTHTYSGDGEIWVYRVYNEETGAYDTTSPAAVLPGLDMTGFTVIDEHNMWKLTTGSGEADDTFTQADFVAALETEVDEYGNYYLTEDLELTEFLTIDQDITIYVEDGVTLTIPSDVVLTLQDVDLIPFAGGTIAVAGTVELDSTSTLQVTGGVLDVADGGQVICNGSAVTLYLNDTAEVKGILPSEIEAIGFANDEASLRTALEKSAGKGYASAYIWQEVAITLTSDLEIPEYTELKLIGVSETAILTVPADVTLTNLGSIWVGADAQLQIEDGGKIVNSGWIYSVEGTITCDGTWEGDVPIYPDQEPENTFTTFAQLQEIAAKDFDQWEDWHYEGEEPLVISADLVISDYLSIYANQVVIASGATVTNGGYLCCNDLEVAGTLNISDASIWISESLTITGAVNLSNGWLNVEAGALITGDDKLHVSGNWGGVQWFYDIIDEASLKEATEKAAAETSSYVSYQLNPSRSLTIAGNITIPANANMYVSEKMTLTVEQGGSLTVNGSLSLGDVLTVNGSLTNNNWISIDYDWGGRLVMGEAGTYSGSGTLQVYGYGMEAPDGALSNLDLTDFDVTKEATDYGTNWYLRYAGDLIKLGTPTELEWGKMVTHEWSDEANDIVAERIDGRPSDISWKNGTPCQNHFYAEVYRENGDSDELVGTWGWSGGSEKTFEYAYEAYAVGTLDLETGDYYFTVTAQGDYTQYRDSDTAVSDIWHYVKPDAKLGVATDLQWNGKQTSFTAPAGNAVYHGGYEIDYYYSADNGDATSLDEVSWCGGQVGYHTGTDWELYDQMLQWTGEGYYYYRVRALSDDITVFCNGDWSELSPAYYLTEVSEQVKTELDSIISDETATNEEKVEAVQNMDTEDLKTAMLADAAVVDQIAQLEDTVGGAAAVEVTNEAYNFDASEISIVGANLNTKTDDGEGVTLVVDKPAEENVIPEAYANSVAVSFSMDLENVEDTENLAVPVQITLPVPAGINPAFLVIFHYHADGTVEEINPYIYAVGDQYYAEFVLTSFSDFVITFRCEEGDTNRDGQLDLTDAEQLLWNVLFDEEEENLTLCDLDGNEILDDEDVNALMWKLLFGK